MHWRDPFTPLEETMHCLDGLVREGKVRYLGFSDTPAWQCVQAHMLAPLRGWTPLTALQFEYSLIERTPEGELLPMAREFGLGVVTWSPLAAGALSGKYSREHRTADSAFRNSNLAARLDERAFNILDLLAELALDLDTTPARVALAWLVRRPGVTAPILGSRTLDQLEENLRALQVSLSADQIARLDDASKPRLAFPASLLSGFESATYGGMTINGRSFSTGITAK